MVECSFTKQVFVTLNAVAVTWLLNRIHYCLTNSAVIHEMPC